MAYPTDNPMDGRGAPRRVAHTPGPWVFQAHQDTHGEQTVIAAENGHIVAVIPSDAWNAASQMAPPQDRPNAALMAAAPDMLAALILARRAMSRGPIEDGSEQWVAVEAIDAAIARAEDR